MSYKDKEKQKQANKEASKRRRDKAKGMTPGMTEQGMTLAGMTPDVTPKYPSEYGLPGCACMMCRAKQSNKSNAIINHDEWFTAPELNPGELNRVPLPGDIDYKGIVA